MKYSWYSTSKKYIKEKFLGLFLTRHCPLKLQKCEKLLILRYFGVLGTNVELHGFYHLMNFWMFFLLPFGKKTVSTSNWDFFTSFEYIQGFNQPSQMLYNVIFPTKTNFPIRSRYVFLFIFSLLIKAFVTSLTYSLFQSNLYVVLASGKGPKNSVYRDIFKIKSPKQKLPDPQLCFTCLTWHW